MASEPLQNLLKALFKKLENTQQNSKELAALKAITQENSKKLVELEATSGDI